MGSRAWAPPAVALFRTFDLHLAARTLVIKAAVQRLRGDDSYFATLWEAIEDLDAYRDTYTAEVGGSSPGLAPPPNALLSTRQAARPTGTSTVLSGCLAPDANSWTA